jgi:hypothetical protein
LQLISYINTERQFLQESVDTNLIVSLTILHQIANQIFFFLKPWDCNVDTT